MPKTSNREFLSLVTDACSRSSGSWTVHGPSELMPGWIVVDRGAPPTRAAGWKLHVSATTWAAEEVLEKALPVLLEADAPFKVAASMQELDALNDGEAGVTQIGKFITVYPTDDAQGVELARRLDAATRGLPGPPIPSDRALSPDSLVHYRFGEFVETVSDSLASVVETMPPMERDAHELSRYSPTAEPDDPFVAAGLASPSSRKAIAARYVEMATLHTSARGSVLLAMDVEAGRLCVLKRAWRHGRAQTDGSDARDRLRAEKEVLETLAGDPRFPRVYEVFEEHGDAYLAMEYVEGPTLAVSMGDLQLAGRTLPIERAVEWGRALASLLGAVHAEGLVYRDLNSMNVIRSGEQLRLVDFELTVPAGYSNPDWIAATPGYSSPELARGAPADAADDVYSLGALLYMLVTNAEPVMAPGRLLDRPVHLLNPMVGPDLEEVIERCLEPDRAARWRSMEDVAAALEGVATGPATGASSRPLPPEPDRLGHARALGTAMRRSALETEDGPAWLFHGHLGASVEYRDLSLGAAGAVLALAELVDEMKDGEQRALLDAAASKLARTRPSEGAGLYIGESGVAVALLRAGTVLDRRDLIEEAESRSDEISRRPHVSSELFVGSAGRLRAHLLVHDHTHDSRHLDAATDAADYVIERSVTSHGGVLWTAPDEGGEPVAFLGYAHGAAGIADTLIDLYEATGDEGYAGSARATVAALEATTIRTLDDSSGIDWPRAPGEPAAGPLWCHGAAGVGTFLVHALAAGVAEPRIAACVEGAAETVFLAGRTLGPTQCHGLAGSIEFLLDVYGWSGDEGYVDRARLLGHILDAFSVERDGVRVWRGDSESEVDPGYLNGYGGIGMALLRLANPGRPRQLSRAGLRYRKPAAS